MPPNNGSDQTTTTRRRPTAERVVPAIPFALTKPRTKPKAKPKLEADAVAGQGAVEEHVTQQNGVAHSAGNSSTSLPVTNGDALASAGGDTPPILRPNGNAVRTPTVDTPGSVGSVAMSLSTGATPEAQTTNSTQPSTPPVPQQAPTESPSSARRLKDHFDMRQIRTELPPAFIPNAEQHTPRSAASSHSNKPTFLPHPHPTHPSAGSIVFGGMDSNHSSPAPPMSAGSGFVPPPQSANGFAPPPLFSPPGHAHHTSEPVGPRVMYGPYPPVQWPARQPYGQQNTPYFHPHAHAPFRYPPREVFSPTDPPHMNGDTSRDGSQASSLGQDTNPRAPLPQRPLSPEEHSERPKPGIPEPTMTSLPLQTRPQAFAPQVFQHPPQPFPPPDLSAHFENVASLRSHLLSQLSASQYVDCRLVISDAGSDETLNFDGHRMILSRSPTLLDFIRTTTTPRGEPVVINIALEGGYTRGSTLLAVLKYLYGGQPLPNDHHRPLSAHDDRYPSNPDRMENVLQYIATGAWLKVPGVAHRGIEVATNLLHWDTISAALAFALQGGLSNIWTAEDASEDRTSTSSSDDSLARPEHTNTPTYDPYSTDLLQRILEFTVHMFPPNFYLDASAPQLSCCPRLPTLPQGGHESRPSRSSDPRLTQIRFGEVPAEEHARPSFVTSTVSSVLLSLPFALLMYVLEHFDLAAKLGADTVASIMRQVVAEREIRRKKTLKALGAGSANGAGGHGLVQNLFWEERVEVSAQHRAGWRLVRRWTGRDTPPSSGDGEGRDT